MAEQEQQIVTLTRGCLIGTRWTGKGKAVSLPKNRAETLIARKHAIAGGTIDEDDKRANDKKKPEANDTPTFEDPEFPGAEVFAEAGILTIADAKKYVEANGDNWFNNDDMKGIGKGTAAKIVEAFTE